LCQPFYETRCKLRDMFYNCVSSGHVTLGCPPLPHPLGHPLIIGMTFPCHEKHLPRRSFVTTCNNDKPVQIYTNCRYVCIERSLAARQAAMWCLFVLPLFYVFCMLGKLEIIRTSKQRSVQSSPKVCRAAVCLSVSHLRDVLGFCFEEHAIHEPLRLV